MRKSNFSAGPAAMPEEVLVQLQVACFDWRGQGVSLLEMPHRATVAVDLLEETRQLFRALLNIPKQFQILFMHGGARAQFSAIPLNLLGISRKAAYLNTGVWSEAACQEAQRYGEIDRVTGLDPDSALSRIAESQSWQLPPESTYVHYCDNETVSGLEFSRPPQIDGAPLVADMSSNILSKPIDWRLFGAVYAGMQKNMGVAGLSVLVVREDLLDQAMSVTPSFLHYKTQVKCRSAYNTLPLFNVYAALLMCQWLDKQGGVEAIQLVNQRKAAKVYALIDQYPAFYRNRVDKRCRSVMNMPFALPNQALEAAFVTDARQRGLINLEGHGSVGGLRASLYNPISEHAVDLLVSCMETFARQHQEYL